ncbi:MAG: hypothetical protein A4E57_00341 [Syntrophorhabdaceae bacterium PtaU1.Bin034]|jgi:hypothetical protein|nr:MAG: hypothetical protein A4E57_00341 [Syntrophorhabdaceae bacterium PtaU1.Bin034]
MKAKYCPLLCEVCPVKRHKPWTRWKVYSRPRDKMELKKIRDEEDESLFAHAMKEAA